MRQKAICIPALCLILMLLAACQPTPDKPVVVNKGDGQIEQKIAAQADAPLPTDLPQDGTRIQKTIKHPNLNISIDIDATAVIEQGKAMPAVKVTPHRFTQEEVDRIYDTYVGDAHFFRVPDGETWDFRAKQDIAETEVRLEYTKKERSDPASIDRAEKGVDRARKKYLQAKKSAEFAAVSHRLCKENLVFGGDLTEGVYGYFEKDGQAYLFTAVNDADGTSSEMSLERFREDVKGEIFEEWMELLPRISILEQGKSLREIPYADALGIAEAAVQSFGAKGMALAHAEAKQYPENTLTSYYTFYFTRVVNGVPCKYDTTGIANDEGYSDIWNYEQLMVTVDQYGLKCINWTAPCDVTQQLSKSTAMIPFEEAMDRFAKMVFVKNSYLEDEMKLAVTLAERGPAIYDRSGNTGKDSLKVERLVVHINRITLGLMRVQSGEEYLLIPVWDFYGYREAFTADGRDIYILAYEHTSEGQAPYKPYIGSVMTISAIDGSIIDRNKGY